ncbi:unnamed protein product, partial [Ectocarpus sp. 13 AM-2016]
SGPIAAAARRTAATRVVVAAAHCPLATTKGTNHSASPSRGPWLPPGPMVWLLHPIRTRRQQQAAVPQPPRLLLDPRLSRTLRQPLHM